jgi:hypothetical protein
MSANAGPLQSDVAEDVTGNEQALIQAFHLWFNPELRSRVTAGNLITPFELQSAQVLFKAGQSPEVRFNNEVSGALEVKVAKAVNAGDPVYNSDIAEIHRFELDAADADAGHFTIFKLEGGWRAFFDFQRNKRSAADLVGLAEQFAIIAELAMERGFQGPFVDTLFSAAELLAKARLMTAAAEDEIKTHRTVGARLNRWGKLGNVDKQFLVLFNELSRLREPARYRGISPVLKTDNPLQLIHCEISALRERLKRFSDDPA